MTDIQGGKKQVFIVLQKTIKSDSETFKYHESCGSEYMIEKKNLRANVQRN